MKLVFPALVAMLDLGAAGVYFYNRQYALSAVWFFYALAAVALGIAGL